jgi:hypothetical protein
MATPSRADYLASVKQASENAWEGMDDSVNDDQKARAAAANVSAVEFIDYAEALSNYEARDDVEPLAQRRAREAGTTFAATDFARAEDYEGGTVVTDPNA